MIKSSIKIAKLLTNSVLLQSQIYKEFKIIENYSSNQVKILYSKQQQNFCQFSQKKIHDKDTYIQIAQQRKIIQDQWKNSKNIEDLENNFQKWSEFLVQLNLIVTQNNDNNLKEILYLDYFEFMDLICHVYIFKGFRHKANYENILDEKIINLDSNNDDIIIKCLQIKGKIIKYGDQSSKEQLNELIKNYINIDSLRQYEQPEVQCIQQIYFYLLIIQVQIGRSDVEELEKYLSLGYSKLKILIKNVKSKDKLVQETLTALKQIVNYFLELLNIFKKLTNPDEIINFGYKNLLINLQIAQEEFQEEIIILSLRYVDYLFDQNQFSEILNILQPIYEIKQKITNEHQLLEMLCYYYSTFLRMENYQKLISIQNEVNSIQKSISLDSIQFVLTYKFALCMFESEHKKLNSIILLVNSQIFLVNLLYQQQQYNQCIDWLIKNLPLWTRPKLTSKSEFRLYLRKSFKWLLTLIDLNNLNNKILFDENQLLNIQFCQAIISFQFDESVKEEERIERINLFIDANEKNTNEWNYYYFLLIITQLLTQSSSQQQFYQETINKTLFCIIKSNLNQELKTKCLEAIKQVISKLTEDQQAQITIKIN